jgi:hypothetical protein
LRQCFPTCLARLDAISKRVAPSTNTKHVTSGLLILPKRNMNLDPGQRHRDFILSDALQSLSYSLLIEIESLGSDAFKNGYRWRTGSLEGQFEFNGLILQNEGITVLVPKLRL